MVRHASAACPTSRRRSRARPAGRSPDGSRAERTTGTTCGCVPDARERAATAPARPAGGIGWSSPRRAAAACAGPAGSGARFPVRNAAGRCRPAAGDVAGRATGNGSPGAGSGSAAPGWRRRCWRSGSASSVPGSSGRPVLSKTQQVTQGRAERQPAPGVLSADRAPVGRHPGLRPAAAALRGRRTAPAPDCTPLDGGIRVDHRGPRGARGRLCQGRTKTRPEWRRKIRPSGRPVACLKVAVRVG